MYGYKATSPLVPLETNVVPERRRSQYVCRNKVGHEGGSD